MSKRTYHEIIVNLDEEALKKSRVIMGFNYCEKLYKIEKEKYYKIRYDTRLKESKPIFDKFQEYVELEINGAVPKSPLGKALDYTKNVLPGIKTFP